MRNLFPACLAAMLALILPGLSLAGNFRVTPTSIKFVADNRTSMLKLTNMGEEAVTVQVDAKEWTETGDAKDQYQPTKDLVFFPKIVTIAKGEEALVRVGYQKKHGAKERTFRVYLAELPVSTPGVMALKMSLTLSVPVFIAPATTTENWEIAGAELGGGLVRMQVKNSGNVHLINSKINLTAFDDQGQTVYTQEQSGWYVLAGATKTYELAFPKEPCLKAKQVKLEAEASGEKREFQLAVDHGLCADRPNPEKDNHATTSGKDPNKAE